MISFQDEEGKPSKEREKEWAERQEESQGVWSRCGAGVEVMGHRDWSRFCRMMEPEKGTHERLWVDKSKSHSSTAAVFKISGLTIPLLS